MLRNSVLCCSTAWWLGFHWSVRLCQDHLVSVDSVPATRSKCLSNTNTTGLPYPTSLEHIVQQWRRVWNKPSGMQVIIDLLVMTTLSYSICSTLNQMAASPWRKYTPWPALCECCKCMLRINPDPSHPSVSALCTGSTVNPFPCLWNYDVVHCGTV